MKKKLCLILALMLTVAFVFASCGGKDSTPGGVVEDNPGGDVVEGGAVIEDAGADSLGDVQSDIKIEEGESIVEKHVPAQVLAFISGKYHLKGTIYSTESAMPVDMSTDGVNFHFTTTTSGISIGILILDEVTYLVQPKTNSYTELSDMLVKTLGLEDDFDITELTNFDVEDYDNTVSKINQSAVTINGEAGICNEYVYDDTAVKLYSIGERLVQIDSYDIDGNLTMQIVVDEISETIPSDQLTLNGMEKASITSFISSFMSAAAAQQQ